MNIPSYFHNNPYCSTELTHHHFCIKSTTKPNTYQSTTIKTTQNIHTPQQEQNEHRIFARCNPQRVALLLLHPTTLGTIEPRGRVNLLRAAIYLFFSPLAPFSFRLYFVAEETCRLGRK